MTLHTLVPWYTTNPTLRKPKRAFANVGSFFDDFFEDFINDAPAKIQQKEAFSFVPHLNVEDTEDAYRVTVEAPGASKDDINISVEDNHLLISGEKKEDFDKSEGKTHFIGRSYGKFERRIPFGKEIDADAVTAEMENGVLAIVVPKKAEAQEKARKITIK